MKSLLKKIGLVLVSVGPGIFGIGYTVGTGSVTTMSKIGADFGTQLIWVLAFACVFSFVLMEAFGRYSIVARNSMIHSVKTKFGLGPGLNKTIAIVMIVGVVAAQWSSLSGILGLSAAAIWETVCLFFPALDPTDYWAVLLIAVVLIAIMYALLMVGRYSFFEKVLIFFVTVMGLSFILSMFIVLPEPGEIAAGFMPNLPAEGDVKLMIAALVGTTMAAPTFVTRPLLLLEKGWGKENMADQRRDAIAAGVLTFLVSGAIMITAAGALHARGLGINVVLDMVYTLEPIAGQFAVALFMTGVLSAGLSSIFPILMVLPWLLSDYESGRIDTDSPRFRLLTGIACLVGLIVPIIGANPIFAQIVTQIVSTFILPLVIVSIMWLINQEKLMGEHRAGTALNIGLGAAFLFAAIISWTAATTVIELLRAV